MYSISQRLFERIIHNHFSDCQIEKAVSVAGDAVRLSGHLAGLSGALLLQMILIFFCFSQTKLPPRH